MEKINTDVFLSLVETGNFRKSADELGYTQAGISYIVSNMEQDTGLSLFIRDRSGVRLSPEGETLLPIVKQMKVLERRFRQTVNDLSGLERGIVRVRVFESIATHWLPDIIRGFKMIYPNIKIEIVSESDALKAEKMLQTGEVDCGFYLTRVFSKFDTIPLVEENIVAIMAPDHPMASEEKFPLSRLGDFPYVGMKYDSQTEVLDIFRTHNIIPNMAYEMESDYAAMAMISKGHGYGIFPELFLKDTPYELRSLEFDEPQTRIIKIGTLDRKNCSKACEKFIEFTCKWVQDHALNTFVSIEK